MKLAADWRDQVERYLRPLYTELDGADTFVDAERRERRIARLGDGLDYDADRAVLLALFHGVRSRLGSLAPGGRWQLLLARIGVTAEEAAALRAGIERLESAPAGVEESLVHDALLLERTGVGAVLARLLHAGRKRVPADRAVAALDAGPPPERFRTARGRELATTLAAEARRWIEALRAALAAERDL